MPTPVIPGHESLETLLQRHWGYDSFLPLQREAIQSILDRRDSLVILPTGGGKSMCYQLPAVAMEGTALVVSPLLALMKDQVDSLVANGVPAASLNSSLSAEERRRITRELREGRLKLLYLSPERLAAPDMQELLGAARISFLAVDEAHCVSQWGHEFRPDYRHLARLREWFPDLSMHAFTATATPEVRRDIEQALALREPERLVGSFDRPNLVYRTVFRRELLPQVRAVLARHEGEAGIIYCIRRQDVDDLSATLQKLGYKALPYHAGLSTEERRANQEAFLREEVDLIVATVAFGMGIDRSNVRYVIHTGMPKSLEHYQQEAGRAGRDRLEAECVLFYSGADPMTWRSIQGEPQTPYDHGALAKISEMYRFCRTLTCRHRFLVQYFGQDAEGDNCGACDVCLGDHQVLDDSLVTAQKILSGVARVKERFGAKHVAEVLRGSKTARVQQLGHDQLSTYGLLSSYQLADIGDWIDQLIGQGYLVREGEYLVLKLTPAGWSLLKGEGQVLLSLPRSGEVRKSQRRTTEDRALAPDEEGLFQALRAWRRDVARDRGVPPYLVLGDASLKELAARRPGTALALREVKGIGEAKARSFGEDLLATIRDEAERRGLSLSEEMSVKAIARAQPERHVERAPRPNATREAAFAAFAAGRSLPEVAAELDRSVSTLEGYLLEYIRDRRVTRCEPWLNPETFERIVTAARDVGAERLKPVYEALGGEVPYPDIKLALEICQQQNA